VDLDLNRKLKKILFTLTFNLSLILMLLIGIQNSSNKSKIHMLNQSSISLPVSFILGINFISGSLAGSIFLFNKK
tara:strand:+ start:1744 stop:1968 length:225 start_codon:yes stop_codon:yes gene_type:complete